MKLLVTLTLLIASTTASAQTVPTFSKSTTFESCTKSWAFACGMRDSEGRTFGTARELTRCEKYTFLPNGTYDVNGGAMTVGGGNGTYRMIGKTVRLTPVVDGKPAKAFDLELSPDGATLGAMKLVR